MEKLISIEFLNTMPIVLESYPENHLRFEIYWITRGLLPDT